MQRRKDFLELVLGLRDRTRRNRRFLLSIMHALLIVCLSWTHQNTVREQDEALLNSLMNMKLSHPVQSERQPLAVMNKMEMKIKECEVKRTAYLQAMAHKKMNQTNAYNLDYMRRKKVN